MVGAVSGDVSTVLSELEREELNRQENLMLMAIEDESMHNYNRLTKMMRQQVCFTA